MAIDTSIYGNQKPLPSFAESFAPFVDMAQKREQIETMKAQRPGIEADAKEKVRIAKRNQDVQDISAKFRVQNPDGSISFDQKGAATALASAGYTPESIELTKGYLDNEATMLKNELDRGQNPVIVAEKKKKLADEYFQGLSNTWAGLKPEQREPFIQNSIKHAAQNYGISPEDPRYMTILKGGGEAVANATVTPFQKEAQKLTERSVAVGERAQGQQFAEVGYTPEGQDPNSAVSRQAREVAAAAGLPVNNNMSQWQIRQLYGDSVANAQNAQITPAGTRAAAVERVGTLAATAEQYDNALSAVADYKKAGGKAAGATVIGEFVGERWDKLVAQKPELGALATMVEVHNSNPKNKNDIIDPRTMSLDVIERKLQAGRKGVEAEAKGAATVAKTQRLPGGQPAQPSAPKMGQAVTRGGVTYIFNGGNPADPKNWIKQ